MVSYGIDRYIVTPNTMISVVVVSRWWYGCTKEYVTADGVPTRA